MRTTLLLSCIFLSFSMSAQNNWKELIGRDHQNDWIASTNTSIKTDSGQTVMACQGDHCWFRSKNTYADFNIKGEFLLDEGGTGKFMFRIQDPNDKWAELSGYSVVFDQNPDQQNTLGSLDNVSRAKWLDSLNFNIWNSFEISAIADHLKVFINEQLVTETHNRRSALGYLKIQLDNTGIQFRNLQVNEKIPESLPGPTIEDYLQSFPAEYQSLFNGKNLSGWQSTGTSEWEVTDGNLHGYSGKEGGFLVSENSYRNFHLKFKFKIIKEDNSGIFIRKPAGTDEISLENSIECNIYDHNGFTHAFSTGALVRHARAWNSMIDFEEWNTGEIYAFEDHIAMYINGAKASEAHLPDFDHPGQLCLQAGLQLALPEKGPSDVYFEDLWIKCIDGLDD